MLPTAALPRTLSLAQNQPNPFDSATRIEFSLARTVGRSLDFRIDDLRRLAVLRGEAFPLVVGDDLDSDLIVESRLAMWLTEGIPPLQDEILSDAAALLKRCDGLLLSGGDDPDPALYGEKPCAEIVPLLPRREAFDLELCRLAFDTGIPTLAVCAGMQTLAIVRGSLGNLLTWVSL